MPRAEKRLVPVALTKLPPGDHSDGGGLYLQVSPLLHRSWIFRFSRSGRARWMGLGPLRDVGLGEARQLAADARRLIRLGLDPIEERNRERGALRAERAKRLLFRSAAERYIEAHRAGWRSPKSEASWTGSLTMHAYPVLGDLAVSEIDTPHILRTLQPIWTTRTETASRLRGRIESILDWCTVAGHREGLNCARWRGHLEALLPAPGKVRAVSHLAALPYVEAPQFMAELRAREGISARALEFAILTAARSGEVLGATWDEIDADTWTVPRERMKGGRSHRVPLSPRCLAILDAVPRLRGNAYLFPGARAGKPLSSASMLEMVRGMRPGLSVHGFRSTFADWAAASTAHPRELIEGSLAHALPNRTEAAYRRGDLLDRRRGLMAEWADFCGG